MLRLVRGRSAQTAIEMLLIIGVILVGVVSVVTVYIQENEYSAMIVAVRDAASQAAVYIENGVVSNKSEYWKLNEIIQNYTKYRSVGFRLEGLNVTSESKEKVTVAVKFTHNLPSNSSRDSEIAKCIGEFFKEYLKDIREFRTENGHLYYAGKLVEFNITVGETSEVVS